MENAGNRYVYIYALEMYIVYKYDTHIYVRHTHIYNYIFKYIPYMYIYIHDEIIHI